MTVTIEPHNALEVVAPYGAQCLVGTWSEEIDFRYVP
jgi:hypothetical protein